MDDSILKGVGNEVLLTVCVGAILTVIAGVLIFTRFWNSNSGNVNDEQNDRSHHSYNNELCPICIGPHRLAVETNCGHKFCGPCIRNYINNQSPGDFTIFGGRRSCPMCRQDIDIMLLSFSQEDAASAELEGERLLVERTAHEYNVRFGCGPRNLWSYIRDCPVLVRHMFIEFFSFGGLVWMFKVRVTVCFAAAIMYLLLPLDIVPEALFGFFGLLDDLIVFFLCAIYVSIIYRRFIVSRGLSSTEPDEAL